MKFNKIVKTVIVMILLLIQIPAITTTGVSSPIEEYDENRFSFTGKESEIETGFYYLGARHYDPNLGVRFTSADPIRFRKGDPQGFNLYAYGNNNPLRFVDPDGASAWDKIKEWGQSIGKNPYIKEVPDHDFSSWEGIKKFVFGPPTYIDHNGNEQIMCHGYPPSRINPFRALLELPWVQEQKPLYNFIKYSDLIGGVLAFATGSGFFLTDGGGGSIGGSFGGVGSGGESLKGIPKLILLTEDDMPELLKNNVINGPIPHWASGPEAKLGIENMMAQYDLGLLPGEAPKWRLVLTAVIPEDEIGFLGLKKFNFNWLTENGKFVVREFVKQWEKQK